MPSNHLILCRPLLFLPSIFPSIRVFSSESVLIRLPKYSSFSFSISPSNDYSGLISFRMDWLDLLAVQRTLKSLLQHQSSKASILRCSAFFIFLKIFLFIFWPCCVACGILVPRPGIEPASPALEAQSLNPLTAREVPSAFFIVQLSHPYMTPGKTIALTRRTFVGKVMSLLFSMLSRFIIALLPRSKHLLISWLQSPCAVILEPKKIKSVTVSTGAC